jgi:[ribosomal protein S5]-alanine N-acetyltransferase
MKLETKRLILRKIKLSDLDDIIEGVNNINISKCTVSIPFPYAKKDGIWFINDCLKGWEEKKKYNFVIVLKSEKKVIGAIGLSDVNLDVGKAETGSWINEKYWRNGYITEAKIALNEFAFNELKLNKLNSPVFVSNKASNATQLRVGYVLEGCLKENDLCKATDKIHDCNQYALFKKNWKKVLPKLKKHLDKKIKSLK